MTKGEMTSLILLAINGGQVTQDANIQRPEVEEYLSAAINYVYTKAKRIARREAMSTGEEYYPTTAFAPTVPVSVLFDTTRQLSYIDIPNNVYTDTSCDGILQLSPLVGEDQFVKLPSKFADKYMGFLLTDTTRFFTELINGQHKTFFKNLSTACKQVLLTYIADISKIGEEDELPIPGDIQAEVIDTAMRFFITDRKMPTDYLNNNNDGPSPQFRPV